MSSDRDIVGEALSLLTPRDRRRYRWAVALQMSMSLLDLAGVLLFGVVGVLAAAAAQDTTPPESISTLLDWVGMADWPLGKAALAIGGFAAVLLIVKSIASLASGRWVSLFLAGRAADVATRMSREFFSLPLVRVQTHTSQWSSYALTKGITSAIVDLLNANLSFRVEATLLVLLGGALIAVDPLTSVVVIVFFGVVVATLNRLLARQAKRAGRARADADVTALASVQDGIATYREVTVADRRSYFASRFSAAICTTNRASADLYFLTNIPRYGLEVAMVAGAALLAIVVLTTGTAETAAGTLALFLAAASRVMPSLLRLNGARLVIHGLRGPVEYAYELDEFLREHAGESTDPRREHAHDRPSEHLSPGEVAASSNGVPHQALPLKAGRGMALEVCNLSVRYPAASGEALSDVSFKVPCGARLALVGPTGAGKSTLADAILGVVAPTRGSVLLDGITPMRLILRHPGAIAYVPQDVALISGTVRANVALGVEAPDIDDERVWAALTDARLTDFLRDTREGLETAIGERGVRLSGGQRQRLGIARALYSQPSLLVMDEATSALDAETEHVITQTLQQLGPEVTTVTIAHRLATIRHSDLVLYLEDGKVLARGGFDEVREAIPQFDRQARLLGL